MRKLVSVCLMLTLMVVLPLTAFAEGEETQPTDETYGETHVEEDTEGAFETEPTTELVQDGTDTTPAPGTGELSGIGETVDPLFGFDAWWKEKALPMVIAFGLSGGAVLLELLPLMVKIKKSSGRFDSSSDAIEAMSEATVAHDAQWKREKEELLTLFATERAEQDERVKQYESQMLLYLQNLDRKTAEMMNTVLTYKETLAASEQRLARMLEHIEKSSDKTEQMVYLGFTNMTEEVVNGTARKIAQVEEDANEG